MLAPLWRCGPGGTPDGSRRPRGGRSFGTAGRQEAVGRLRGESGTASLRYSEVRRPADKPRPIALRLADEEMAAIKRQLAEANVPAYAKIIDVSQARSELTREQVQKVADLTRGAPGEGSRGPVAFVINPERIGFANVFADRTHGERPIHVFQRLH